MRRVKTPLWFRSPGWLGLRIGRRYLYLRDVSRHRLLFSERNGRGRRRIAGRGTWQLWLKVDPAFTEEQIDAFARLMARSFPHRGFEEHRRDLVASVSQSWLHRAYVRHAFWVDARRPADRRRLIA